MVYPDGSKIQWREYSDAAFTEGRQQLKPVMMLISARWCHWCHVYEEETLEDADISRNINGHYIPIFIDADRRRDLARQYLAGGWPTTVLFDFNGRKLVSFSGYLNKTSLMELLANAAEGKIEPEAHGADIVDERKPAQFSALQTTQFVSDYDGELAILFDELYGGFGKGQKAPSTYALDYLIVQYAQKKKTLWKEIIAKSINGMQRLFDQEEGGIYRYAATRDWGEPHYEKLLKENAAFSDVVLKAGKVLENPGFVEMATRNLEWMKSKLYDGRNGGFFGSQAANEHYYTTILEDRKKQIPPYVDKTKYCDWNAEAAIAFLHAHKLLAKLEYWEIADGTLEFMKERLLTDEGMMHYFDEAEGAKLDGVLLDNAWAAVAFFEAFRVGKQLEHQKIGEKILTLMISKFYSEEKKAFIERNSTSVGAYRRDELRSPNIRYYENAVACWALVAGFGATGNAQYLELLKKVLPNFMYTDNNIDQEALVAQIASNLQKI